ncbi:MAG: hypothetical protein U0792_23650 [Gemmataceae bacterium]
MKRACSCEWRNASTWRRNCAFGAARGFDAAIQGEVIGPGIQQNKYGLTELSLRVFNVFDVSGFRYPRDHADMLTAAAEMGLEAVPQLGTMVLNHSVDELVALSEGMSVLSRRHIAKGLCFAR